MPPGSRAHTSRRNGNSSQARDSESEATPVIVPSAEPTEGEIVNACIRWLFAHGGFVWRNNTGAWTPPGGSKPIYYGKKGSADIIGLTVTVHQRSGMKIG
jgi:hypothetical protein